MSYAIAQVTLQRDSGLPEDVIVNTMHFEDDSGFGTDAGITDNGAGLINRIGTFYTTIGGDLSSGLTGAGTVKLYNHNDVQPRIPKMQGTFAFTPGTTMLPAEVAMAISFKAAPASGVNPARRRGRIFVGPLAQVALAVTTGEDTSDPRMSTAKMTSWLNAFRTMARGGAGTFRLAIFSQTTFAATGSLDEAYTDASLLWISNDADTIRSRGARATRRLTASLENTDAPVLAA
jgi:hypothetical protein